MKKRIFISAHYLELGGAETSLIGLLGTIDYSKYDVDLFLQAVRGEMLQYVPKEVNILPEIGCYSMIEEPISLSIKKGYWRVALARLVAKAKFAVYARKHHPKDAHTYFDFLDNEITKMWPSLYHLGEYDLAISYIAMKTIVLDKVRAKKKVCWIHTDYSTVDCYKPLALPLWNRFDKIISISPDVTKAFLKYLPETADKIVECENILPKELVLRRANVNQNENENLFECNINDKANKTVVNLLSVGRICEAKNYDNIPYMAKAMKELFNDNNNVNDNLSIDESTKNVDVDVDVRPKSFHWYIIGPGDHSAIDALSKKLGVDDVVTFLGPSTNPYPYIKACDIYVHPSRYEGKSIVVREAQILCKPVIITNYPTAKSQINNGVDGIICELDNQKIAEAIYDLAMDNAKQAKIVEYLKNHDFAGVDEVTKIYKLINNNVSVNVNDNFLK